MKEDKQLIKDILTLANVYGWEYYTKDDNCKMLSVVADGKRINIYYTKMTVSVAIPKQKQIYFKRVSMEALENIFIKNHSK